MTAEAEQFALAEQALGTRYHLERVVSANAERVLFVGLDRVLNRRVSIRVNFSGDDPVRAWFLREAEALAQLDHPAIRHVYDVGVVGDLAFRVGNWVDGESLETAAQRGPRLYPAVHSLARDLLSALEHAHTQGILVRRVVPAGVILSHAGRGTVTDLRFCSWTLPMIPSGVQPTGQAFMAPEVRDGAVGEPASDIYTAGAVLYFALTGRQPDPDPDEVPRPSDLRPTTPRTVERIVIRALKRDPADRYLSAAEMLEDFASEAGSLETVPVRPAGSQPGAAGGVGSKDWEKLLRRALGDDYELLDAIGAGGFGRVYRARDLHLEREVALKVLHPALTRDPAGVERFRREAQLAARLSHPNIVDIYDIQGRSGLLWYTMELVRGPNLAQFVEEQGPLTVPRLLRLLREALAALAQAHAQGLVHRDIKPENMLIAPGGSLKITDFGLALALRGPGRFSGATSQSGTPQFASPEQLLGELVDQRSDLYSLAAVAYFALLGYPPFAGATPQQILARQATDQVPDLREERSDLSPAIARVLARALLADPNRRFASAAEFQQALREASRQSPWQRALDLVRGAAQQVGRPASS
jgi:serine/threonine protein kinase